MSASEEIEKMLRSTICEDQKMNNLLKSMYSVREECEYGCIMMLEWIEHDISFFSMNLCEEMMIIGLFL